MDVGEALAARRILFQSSTARCERIYRSVGGDESRLSRYDRSLYGFADLSREIAATGELYGVADDMTSIVATAWRSMPRSPLTPADVPSPSGLLIYSNALTGVSVDDATDAERRLREESPIVGFAWATTYPPHYDRAGVMIAPLVDTYDGGQGILWDLEDTVVWFFGEDEARHRRTLRVAEYASPLRSTWLTMAQKLSATEVEQAPRAERRRSEREGLPSTVNVVRVRKREQRPTDGSRDIEWSHRWLVAGHWRRQWCPSVGAHRPTWIAGYVKGPEEKPLVVKDRVTTWVR